jgi:hypothetical protein
MNINQFLKQLREIEQCRDLSLEEAKRIKNKLEDEIGHMTYEETLIFIANSEGCREALEQSLETKQLLNHIPGETISENAGTIGLLNHAQLRSRRKIRIRGVEVSAIFRCKEK